MKIKSTQNYREWFSSIKDEITRARVNLRVKRLADGNPGQHRILTGGVIELKLSFGPGYRVYYTIKGGEIILLLIGGDKSTQQKDIVNALKLAEKIKEELP
jgi:putative addiction module killer protein